MCAKRSSIDDEQTDSSSQNCPVSLRNLIIFGDSYSAPIEDFSDTDNQDIFDDNELETWVDFLVKTLDPKPNVRNFAEGGASAQEDLSGQLKDFLKSNQAIDPRNATYVLFIGINDVGTPGMQPDFKGGPMEIISDCLDALYKKADARNFIIMDVPPMERCPDTNLHDMSDVIADRVGLWNTHLARVVDIFCQSAVDATVFQYSANACILDVLDHPQQFGFEEENSELECGRIWKDGLHMTPGVHRILAQGVYQDVLVHRD